MPEKISHSEWKQVGDARTFGEPDPGPDPTSFQINNTSEEYYASAYYLAHRKQVQPVPAPRDLKPIILADIVGQSEIAQIEASKRIVFHAVGDTGATTVDEISKQDGVADRMVQDVNSGGPDAPSFFFHLGDVVYSFGEDRYYHDQFYEPYRGYDRPIFAIPGNHDGMVFGGSLDKPAVPSLQAFLRNFCADSPEPSPDSGGLTRSVMTQPGVYFTLDAPFVSIIGLYSNVLDGPGIISSQNGHFEKLNDDQLNYLRDQLARLKADHDAHTRAVIIAVHHPPTSVDSKHGGAVGLSADIDTCCVACGLWPDAVLSGHTHLYQRFSRRVSGLDREIPYITSGSGGYAATAPKHRAKAGSIDGEFQLVTPPIVDFGYLTVTVDVSRSLQLRVKFKSVRGKSDSVVVDLTR